MWVAAWDSRYWRGEEQLCHVKSEGVVVEMQPLPNYGIEVDGDLFLAGIPSRMFYPIPEDERITMHLQTIMDGQRVVRLPVYCGQNKKASENEEVGDARVLLPRGIPLGSRLDVRMWLDADGVFEFQASLENGCALEVNVLGAPDADSAFDKHAGAIGLGAPYFSGGDIS